jgi:alpha,alpha-trehalose phosphorylase
MDWYQVDKRRRSRYDNPMLRKGGTFVARIFRAENFPIEVSTLQLQETLFHNANGYLGVRGTLEEGAPENMDTMRGMYINGFYDIVPMKQAEKLYGLIEDKESMLNLADAQTIRISVEGEWFSMFSGQVLEVERTLDMDAGITTRRAHWRSPGGREAEFRFVRMASFDQPSLFTIDVSITPLNFSGAIGRWCTITAVPTIRASARAGAISARTDS